MKKQLTTIIIATVIITPYVAFASWWNPFSWNIFQFFQKSEDKTQILENRIKELEDKLQGASTSVSVTGNESKKVVASEQSKAQSKIVVADQVTKTPVPIVNQVLNPTTTYSQADFLSLETKYTNFIAKISDEITNLNGSKSPVKLLHQSFLAKLSIRAKADLAEVDKLNLQNPMPAAPIEKYNAEFVSITNDYNTESTQFIKGRVIEYFLDNKNYLYQTQMHIEAANILDLYDRAFGTKYAKDFRLTKTQQETVEFADSFLLDQKYN